MLSVRSSKWKECAKETNKRLNEKLFSAYVFHSGKLGTQSLRSVAMHLITS